jgi:aerobic carbon-monoxide dehydrogenase small subunit
MAFSLLPGLQEKGTIMADSQFTDRQTIRLRVNGQEVEREAEVRKLLADFLREDLELTATHLGCEHGVCGACTVILNGDSVRSCLLFAVQADGGEILTVEGLAHNGQLHPIQQAFWNNHALQCGFCTSGFLMSTYDLLQKNPHPGEEEVRHGLSGNLCRCTGYANVVKAVMAAAKE